MKVNMQHSVFPISKAAASLAALIKRARANQEPIAITQKGYPTGVILSVELFTALETLVTEAEALAAHDEARGMAVAVWENFDEALEGVREALGQR